MSIRKRTSFVGFTLACAILVATNVHCGEYLLAHYLFSSDGPFAPVAAVKQAGDCPEIQTEALPAVLDETVQPDIVAEAGPVLSLENSNPTPSQPDCLQGDLNKDGKVDGLDVQVLVNCLLKQQSS